MVYKYIIKSFNIFINNRLIFSFWIIDQKQITIQTRLWNIFKKKKSISLKNSFKNTVLGKTLTKTVNVHIYCINLKRICEIEIICDKITCCTIITRITSITGSTQSVRVSTGFMFTVGWTFPWTICAKISFLAS